MNAVNKTGRANGRELFRLGARRRQEGRTRQRRALGEAMIVAIEPIKGTLL